MNKAPEESRTQLLRILTKTVPELFRAAPAETGLLSMILVVQAFVPVLTIYLARLTVDGMTALSAGESASVTLLVVWWTLTLLVGVVLSPIAQVLQGNVAELFTAHVNLTLKKRPRPCRGSSCSRKGAFTTTSRCFSRCLTPSPKHPRDARVSSAEYNDLSR